MAGLYECLRPNHVSRSPVGAGSSPPSTSSNHLLYHMQAIDAHDQLPFELCAMEALLHTTGGSALQESLHDCVDGVGSIIIAV